MLKSVRVHGYHELALDPRDLGECCCKHRVARLLNLKAFVERSGAVAAAPDFAEPVAADGQLPTHGR